VGKRSSDGQRDGKGRETQKSAERVHTPHTRNTTRSRAPPPRVMVSGEGGGHAQVRGRGRYKRGLRGAGRIFHLT
jgi:hypothetical protein